MRVQLALAAAALAVSVTACSGSAKPAAQTGGATVPTAAPTTTTTDPFAVPATIDAAYVNRVLAGLDALVGDVVRMVVATKFIPPEAYARLRAAYGDDSILQGRIDGFQSDIRGGLVGYRLPAPGNKRSEVAELLSATGQCIFAKVRRDYSDVSTGPIPELSTQWIAVRPLDRSRDLSGHNSVGWAFIYDGFERGFIAPPVNPCSSS